MNSLFASVAEAIRRSTARLSSLQSDDGAWEGEVVWSPAITAQYVLVRNCIGKSVSGEETADYVKYFWSCRTAEGGWGLHPESQSYLFVTTLVYVALRILGVLPEDSRLTTARDIIRKRGSPLCIPSWGKLWLAFCNLYKYSGINPVMPELWLLPSWLPFHPSRFYCHTRLIYLGMSYLWGRKFCRAEDDLCRLLRKELYSDAYESLDFPRSRGMVSERDCFVPPSAALKSVYAILGCAQNLVPNFLRRRACARALDIITFEQQSTDYVALSPVNGLLNILALHDANPNDPAVEASLSGVNHWLHKDSVSGARFCGARSQAWDTAFVVEAVSSAGENEVVKRILTNAGSFLIANQCTGELPDNAMAYRSSRLGGWCFCDSRHGWPVSDTTAEAMSALMTLRRNGLAKVDLHVLDNALRFLLSRQNPDGGWSSYERRRGSIMLEKLNPSEMFGDCMVEHSYVECTGSALCAFEKFGKCFPDHKENTIVSTAMQRGIRFLLAAQESDGTWQGFWGVNRIYGTLFAVRGLLAAGTNCDSVPVRRACNWLVTHQKADGGWGEHWTGLLENRYVEHLESQVIQTAWALMTLLFAHDDRREVIDRGIAFLIERCGAGGWPRESVAGAFFKTAMLHYDLYREYFPLWALGLYRGWLEEMGKEAKAKTKN
jgi:lanosterol synthase